MILLIDNYDSFTYNLCQCIEALGFECRVVRNDAITLQEIKEMGPSHIVISPGPGNPDSAGISLKVIESFGERVPILGVCLGHQSIGQFFGAKVIRAPKPKHGKLSQVYHDASGLYENTAQPLTAARYHSLILEKETLPECLEVTSETEDGIIMGIRHRRFPVEGVQFHPESIATQDGQTLIENFLKRVSGL